MGLPLGTTARTHDWQPVCQLEDLEIDRGATALVHGQAIALFRLVIGGKDQIFALGNHDPFARTAGLAKGIVGTRRGVPFVGSPAHRHAFDLRTGVCLEDGHFAVPAYGVKVEDGMVFVGNRIR